MGFGLLLIGYITVLGVLPESFIYVSWGIYIAIIGGLLMLAGFCRLAEYNVFFKAMKYITVAYIIILLGFSPFEVLYKSFSENFMQIYIIVSKIIKIFFLFGFHYFLLSGILALAKEIENIKVIKITKINIYFTFVFFSAFVLEFFFGPAIALLMLILGLVYFILIFANLYSCYMRITYEGHDEAIDAKYEEKKNKKKK